MLKPIYSFLFFVCVCVYYSLLWNESANKQLRELLNKWFRLGRRKVTAKQKHISFYEHLKDLQPLV